MKKSTKVLQITSYEMAVVGAFSIVTGIMAILNLSDLINDEIGNATLFHFINGGYYFALCGIIHIAAAAFALHKISTAESKLICIPIGLCILAWQLSAFIYLFTTARFISIRAGLMTILPMVYLTVSIICTVKDKTEAVNENGQDNQNRQKISSRKNFFNFNFSFRRKSIGGIHMPGKLPKQKHLHINMTGKRRSAKMPSMRKFTRRR